jgi:hypothetical protein
MDQTQELTRLLIRFLFSEFILSQTTPQMTAKEEEEEVIVTK